ncbi:hypothetical protein [Ectobacillus ponti]|uniref:Uncharacterized protein n=1 Tax=Ectobacillus ponti TaxID=2961894 RepID=A0AA41X8K0_9BACI|nr:hypothetical protein [Ectobacillus ponti]MCP8970702.1 hypothetical protein [Ectobacillus ponti]
MRNRQIWLPLLVVLALLTLVFYEHMKLQIALPASGWSRSVPLEAEAPLKLNTFVQKGQNAYHVYTTGQQVVHAVYDGALHVQQSEKLPAAVPEHSPLWADGKRVVYLQNGSLTESNGGEQKVMDTEVRGFLPSAGQLVYWKDAELYLWRADSGKRERLAAFSGKIFGAAADEASGSFVAVHQPDQTTAAFTLFKKAADGAYTQTKWPSLSFVGTEALDELQLVQTKEGPVVFYGTFSNAQGIKTYRAYEWQVKPDKPDEEQKPQLMRVKDRMYGTVFENPYDLQAVQRGDHAALLFIANGSRGGKNEGYNVYEAKKEDGAWVAERRSTTSGIPSQPFWIGDSVAWTHFADNTYKLYGATQDLSVVAKSREIQGEDWKGALYATMSALFGGIMMPIMAMLWLTVPVIFYVIVYFFRVDDLENGKMNWVEYVLLALYAATQLAFFMFSLDQARLLFAPAYLTFSGSFVVLPLLLAAVCFVLLRYVRHEEWGPLAAFFYYAGINILFISCLFGPFLL